MATEAMQAHASYQYYEHHQAIYYNRLSNLLSMYVLLLPGQKDTLLPRREIDTKIIHDGAEILIITLLANSSCQ